MFKNIIAVTTMVLSTGLSFANPLTDCIQRAQTAGVKQPFDQKFSVTCDDQQIDATKLSIVDRSVGGNYCVPLPIMENPTNPIYSTRAITFTGNPYVSREITSNIGSYGTPFFSQNNTQLCINIQCRSKKPTEGGSTVSVIVTADIVSALNGDQLLEVLEKCKADPNSYK